MQVGDRVYSKYFDKIMVIREIVLDFCGNGRDALFFEGDSLDGDWVDSVKIVKFSEYHKKCKRK